MAKWDKPKSAARPRLGNRIFTIVVLALLLALCLSAIFVPLGYFRSQGEVMVSYGSVTVRRDLYVYWLSTYKYAYLVRAVRSDPSAADTAAYWTAMTDDGITRAEEARREADAWIKRIVFAGAHFEEDDETLDEKTREGLEDTYRRLLQYELNTEQAYDKAAKKIGFTYVTVRRALLYQSEGNAYVASMTAEEYELLCAFAEREVVIRDAAAKIDFVRLPTDSRLYLPD
ncbi:MAG: hypothetical protein J5958_05110 [Clostridia bacterium]|nr:hypothetical protein [Clostridia bacterium]